MPRHVDHQTRRNTLYDATVALARESGFSAVTIRAVAQRIGLSTSVVTHYCDSREELVRGATQRELGRIRELLLEQLKGLDERAALRCLLEVVVMREHEDINRFWLALMVGSSQEPGLREELDAYNTWWSGQVSTRMASVVPEGRAEVATDLLDVVVDGLVMGTFEAGDAWSQERRERLLRWTCSVLDLED